MKQETEARGPGRPPTLVGSKRRLVYLDAVTIDLATRLGDGNLSAGLRLAVQEAVAAVDAENSGRARAEQEGT